MSTNEHVKVLEELRATAARFSVHAHVAALDAAIAALKALDAEPVAWIHENGISLLTHYDMVRLHRVSVERRREWTPLYAAAPAQEAANG